MSVIVGLLNQQGIIAGGAEGSSLKEQIMALAQKSGSKDLNLDVPVNSSESKFNFDGLAGKIQEAISKKSDTKADETSESLEQKAKELLNLYIEQQK